MGLLPLSHHLSLIQSCYPAPKLLSSTPLSAISPDSNALSKLTFYAQGRPKKLPKVVKVVRGQVTEHVRSRGEKERKKVVVGLMMMRELVKECRSELVCCREDALEVVLLALGARDLSGGTAKGDKGRDEVVLLRGVELFSAITTFSTSSQSILLDPPIFNLYLQCLESLRVIVREEAEIPSSLALQALRSASLSENLYSSSGIEGYQKQTEYILSGLLVNIGTGNSDEEWDGLESRFPPIPTYLSTFPILSSRSPPKIQLPHSSTIKSATGAKSFPASTSLLSFSLESIRALFTLSNSSQLVVLINAWSSTLSSSQSNEEEWSGETETQLVDFILRATREKYRSTIFNWFVERITSTAANSSGDGWINLLEGLLRSSTKCTGLEIGRIATKLIQVMVDPQSGSEELEKKLMSTIISLGGGSRIYYSEQGNDLVRSVVDSIRRLSFGGSDNGNSRLVERLIETLRGVMEEFQKDSGDGVETAERRPGLGVLNGNGHGNGTTGRGASEMTIRPSADVRLATIVKGKAPEEGIPESSPEEEAVELLLNGNGNSVPLLSPSIPLISFPLSSISHSSSIRNSVLAPISYETILPSMFLLTLPDTAVRRSYEKFLIGYLKVRTAEAEKGGKLDEDEVEFVREVARGIWTLVNSTSTISGVEATDYSALREISSILLSTTSAHATIELIPMLLNLEEQTHTESGRERAVKEFVRSELREVGKKWAVEELATAGSEQKFDRITVIVSLARSMTLQKASGMEKDKLEQVLGKEWSGEISGRIGSSFKPTNKSLYKNINGASRSIVNLSRNRISSLSSTVALSTRAPSLADLQASLTGTTHSNNNSGTLTRSGSRSRNTSAGTSFISTSQSQQTGATTIGGSYLEVGGRRRTSRASRESVLAGLGLGGELDSSGTGGDRSRRGSRLSVVF